MKNLGPRPLLRLALLCAGVAALTPTPALARDGDADDERAAPAAGLDEDAVSRAEAVAQRAFAHYQSAEYLQAVALYLEAYEISPSADVLYNLARLYDRHLDDPELAMQFYRRVVAEPGAPPERAARASERLAELRLQTVKRRRARSKDCDEPSLARSKVEPAPEPRWTTLQQTGVGMALVGLAALGAGVGFGVSALADDEDNRFSHAATLSTLSFAGAGVLLAAGGSLYVWGDDAGPVDEARGASLAVAATALPAGAAVGVLGRF